MPSCADIDIDIFTMHLFHLLPFMKTVKIDNNNIAFLGCPVFHTPQRSHFLAQFFNLRVYFFFGDHYFFLFDLNALIVLQLKLRTGVDFRLI